MRQLAHDDYGAPAVHSSTKESSDNVITWSNVSKNFETDRGSHAALRNVSLSVSRREFVALVGPSGCGKTTLLNLVAGLIQPSSGSVTYGGVEVTGVNTKVGYLTQKDTLLPWKRIRENVTLPLQLRGVPKRERTETANRLIAQVGLRGFERHFPSELSGGMRRRALLARSLAYQPDVLLMDEPFVSLDAQIQLLLQNDLLRIWEQHKMTIVLVTHDLAEAVALADRVVMLSRPPSRVTLVREVDLLRPRDAREIRADPRFGELCDELWRSLEFDKSLQEGGEGS